MWNKIPAVVAASRGVEAERFRVELAEAVGSISSRFARREPLAHAADLVLGLVSGLESKICWTIAQQAGAAPRTGCSTKPALAAQMIEAALRAGTSARWAAGDAVYGADPGLRACLRHLGLGYVLAIGCNRTVPTSVGPRRVDALTVVVPENAWYRYAAENGSKGRRWYSWALVDILAEPDGRDLGSGFHTVLVRRNDTTGELVWYRCWSPRPVALAELVSVAGRRWNVEESFPTAKGTVGLDQHQVQKWSSWHRWTTLAMSPTPS